VKVAIPTDDGIRIAARFGRSSGFVVADVGLGAIAGVESRKNPPRTRPEPGRPHRDRNRLVSELLADCRVVIATSMGDTMRRALSRRGMEVVITSEELVDRVLALFALIALKDESRIDPEDQALLEPIEDETDPSVQDEFDG